MMAPAARGERATMPPTVGRGPAAIEDLDLRRRSLAVMRAVTIRDDVRRRMQRGGLTERLHSLLRTDGRRGLEIAATEMVQLCQSGAHYAELALFPEFLATVVADLCPPGEASVSECERLEHLADVAEDGPLPRTLCAEQLTATELMERARLVRAQGAASFQLARAYEAEARRQQLGLTGAPTPRARLERAG